MFECLSILYEEYLKLDSYSPGFSFSFLMFSGESRSLLLSLVSFLMS